MHACLLQCAFGVMPAAEAGCRVSFHVSLVHSGSFLFELSIEAFPVSSLCYGED